jgi:hypothetical protein
MYPLEEVAVHNMDRTLFEAPSLESEVGPRRRARPQPCSEGDIAWLLGVPLGTGRNELQGFDQAFAGTTGARFRDLIVRAANEFSLHPAILAVNALAETDRAFYMRRGPVSNVLIGLDHWDEQRQQVRRRLGVTFTTSIIVDPGFPNCTIVGGVCHFINERGNDTGRMHLFRSGRDGLRAMAAWLRVLEGRLIDSVGNLFGWVGISEPLRMALIRLSYNPGRNNPRELAQRTLATVEAGGDPRRHFPLTGAGGTSSPLRTSVIRAAQAWHLANTVVGAEIPCPSGQLPRL